MCINGLSSLNKAVVRTPALLLNCLLLATVAASIEVQAGQPASTTASVPSFVQQYCAGCHNSDKKKGDLDLEAISGDPVTQHSEKWEKVAHRLRTRQMPPPDKKRPDESTYRAVLANLEKVLDLEYARNPNPGRTETFRRLNRTEYQNSIRDLLGVEIDAATLLPKDDAGHGFDNVTVGTLSPTLLDRYISAAQKVSRLAVGA